MKLLSVNVGQVQPIQNGKPSGKTGIFKQPQAEPVFITPFGLAGDAIVDKKNHGGSEQAVYLFTQPDYEWWSGELGYPLAAATFGENLTISEGTSADLHIGDRFQIGSVVLEITSPRIACVTLAARMGDPQFVKKFRRAGRCGAYCRVLQAGYVHVNDPVEYLPYSGEQVSVVEVFRAFYRKNLKAEQLQRFLAVPIHSQDRLSYAAKLAKIRE